MPALEALLRDAAQKRSGDLSEYTEAWGAFVRYLASCLEAKRGLHLPSLCKVGWWTSKKRTGAAEHRPFFQLTEQFCRSCGMAQEMIKKHCKHPPGELCPLEDFNFSKASIKFSGKLTKDQMSSSLRSIVQQLAESIADRKDVQIVFQDIGKLSVKGGMDPAFAFSPDFLVLEGAAPTRPGSAAADDAGDARGGAAAFRRDAPADAEGLGVDGRATLPVPAAAIPPPASPPPRPALSASASAPDLGDAPTANLTNAQYKKEVAYKEAMDRHISAMEARAAEAIEERHAWDSHMNECLHQEKEEITSKRCRAQTNLHFLKHQIQMGEERKRDQRKEDIASASAHDFPNFSQANESGSKEFVESQRAKMRAALDDQVRTNNTLRNLAKQRERTMEINQLQANREEMAMLRNAERAKKAYDRETLATAWNSEIRMKNIWKAIEGHNKVGSSHAGSHAPQVLALDGPGLPPPSRGGQSVASAGRLLTGNSRRVPLGASSSLGRLEGCAR